LQVVEAILYIYSKYIVYYNLGCYNFLVQDNSTLVLCNFGRSSIDSSKILEFPKPRYTRPRFSYSNESNIKDNIFVLGTILYKISTGNKPYKEKSDKEIISLFRSQDYSDLKELLLPGIGNIIRNCWLEYYSSTEQIIYKLYKKLLILQVLY
jgi:hypothetical protein